MTSAEPTTVEDLRAIILEQQRLLANALAQCVRAKAIISESVANSKRLEVRLVGLKRDVDRLCSTNQALHFEVGKLHMDLAEARDKLYEFQGSVQDVERRHSVP